MVNINKYINASLYPAGGHQGSHKAHQAGNQRCSLILPQGRCNGKVGYFPKSYVEKLEPGEKVLQVIQGLEISEGQKGIKLLKDQVNHFQCT